MMATLLEAETIPYPHLRRGEIIEGTVVGTDRDGILVDIGAKSEGVVPPHEMHCLRPEGPSSLSTGDKVLVFVVQPESPEGQIILSLDRARGERGWRVLQDYMDQNKAFDAHATGSNKGGLLVNVEGVNAFVPLSQIVAGPDRGAAENTERALSEWVGKTLLLKVIELNRRRNRAILSERAAVQEKRASEKERLLQELHEGDVRSGRITSIRDFGVFVDMGGADGLVHLSELSWERTPNSPHELFKVGETVEVYVLKVDHESKKIALSVRRAQPERWEEIVSQYREGQIVPGQVTKLAPFGAFVRLEGPIEGLIHISELVDRRVTHPKEIVEEGDVVPVKIVRIEHDRHRLGLSLRQARDKAEEDGWAFNDSGGVVSALPEALAKFGVDAQARAAGPSPEAAGTAEVAEAAAGEEVATEAEAVGEAAVESPDEAQARAEAEEAPQAEAEIAEAGADEDVDLETAGAVAVAVAEPALEAEAIAEPEAAIAVEELEATEAEAAEPEAAAEAEVEAALDEPALEATTEAAAEADEPEAAEADVVEPETAELELAEPEVEAEPVAEASLEEASEADVTEEQPEALNKEDVAVGEAEATPAEADVLEPDASGETEGGN